MQNFVEKNFERCEDLLMQQFEDAERFVLLTQNVCVSSSKQCAELFWTAQNCLRNCLMCAELFGVCGVFEFEYCRGFVEPCRDEFIVV